MDSGPELTAAQMVAGVRALAKGWKYDRVSIGYPGVVVRDRPATEPHNLGKGWVGFDYDRGFGCPVRIVNDAAMQALGGYQGGKHAVPGLRHRARHGHDRRRRAGADGARASAVQEGDVRGLRRRARARALRQEEVAQARRRRGGRLMAALEPEDVVIGGGNARNLQVGDLPAGCRLGANSQRLSGGLPPVGRRARREGGGQARAPAKRARKTARK